MDEQGQDSQKSDKWRMIAGKVDSLIRKYGIEQFRDQTRQAASEYVAAKEQCKSREEQRREMLKKKGVLHRVEDLPDRPEDDNGKWHHWIDTFRGGLNDFKPSMPPNRLADFRLVKERGFPNDTDCDPIREANQSDELRWGKKIPD